jgi:hypothetical protein
VTEWLACVALASARLDASLRNRGCSPQPTTQVSGSHNEWNFHGTKSELSDELLDATGIHSEVLDDDAIGILSNIPLARRTYWASDGITTRQQDMAYCRLRIFNFNMSLLHGESNQAFIRL